MTDDDPKLVERAEKLVAELPLKEPDWETLADQVEKESLLPPATDESLFVAPALAAEPGEPTEAAVEPGGAAESGAASDGEPRVAEPVAAVVEAIAAVAEPKPEPIAAVAEASPEPIAAVAEAKPELVAAVAEPPREAVGAAAGDEPSSQREPVSLLDLARASVARRGTAGSASIAKESLDLASQRRGQAEPLAGSVQPAVSGRAADTIPPARGARSGDSRGAWIGLAIASIGLAAGFGLYLTAEREKQTIIVPGATPVSLSPENHGPEAAAPAEPKQTPGQGSEPAVEGPRGVSLDALAREAAAPASPGAAPAIAGGHPAAAPAGAGAASVRPERVVLDEDRTRNPVPPAELATRPPGSATLKPAELNRDSGAADRPSAGAAQAAVGAVLGAARSCIAGHARPSSATLVFGSSGEVSSVSVGGEAAGTPAAGCIESALKKARVQPFAAPTFSLAVTVRPP